MDLYSDLPPPKSSSTSADPAPPPAPTAAAAPAPTPTPPASTSLKRKAAVIAFRPVAQLKRAAKAKASTSSSSSSLAKAKRRRAKLAPSVLPRAVTASVGSQQGAAAAPPVSVHSPHYSPSPGQQGQGPNPPAMDLTRQAAAAAAAHHGAARGTATDTSRTAQAPQLSLASFTNIRDAYHPYVPNDYERAREEVRRREKERRRAAAEQQEQLERQWAPPVPHHPPQHTAPPTSLSGEEAYRRRLAMSRQAPAPPAARSGEEAHQQRLRMGQSAPPPPLPASRVLLLLVNAASHHDAEREWRAKCEPLGRILQCVVCSNRNSTHHNSTHHNTRVLIEFARSDSAAKAQQLFLAQPHVHAVPYSEHAFARRDYSQ